MWRSILAITLLLLIAHFTGCANPYQNSYSGTNDARNLERYDDSESDLKVYTTKDFTTDAAYLVSKSYWPIGQSAFQAAAAMISAEKLRQHAMEIGAHAVLVNSRYSHTTQGALPLNVPKQSTTYFSGAATATGSGGFASATGSGTATTYYSETQMLPFSVDQYQVGVLYFAKVKHRLGLAVVRPNTNVLRQVGTNAGMLVYAVVEDTPAFYADFFPGDYILRINGKSIYSFNDYMAAINRNEGETITIAFLREGEELSKTVRVRRVDGTTKTLGGSGVSKHPDIDSQGDKPDLQAKKEAAGDMRTSDTNNPKNLAKSQAGGQSPRQVQLGLYLKDLTVVEIDSDRRRDLRRSQRDLRDAGEMYSVTPNLVWTVPDGAVGIKKVEGTLRIEKLESGEHAEFTNWKFEHDLRPGSSVVQRNRPWLVVDKPGVNKEWIYKTDVNHLGARFFPSRIVYEDGVEVEF